MAKEKIDISIEFLQKCKEDIKEMGAVRRPSFARYLEVALDISPDLAEKVIDEMLRRQDIIAAKYAGASILKTDRKTRTVYDKLDIFDAYICLFEEAKERDEKGDVYLSCGVFPADFVFSDTEGMVYSVFLYDAHLSQKISVFERKKKDKENVAVITVFPIGTNLKKAEIPSISTPYRYAVVRKSAAGNTVCQMTELQGLEKA